MLLDNQHWYCPMLVTMLFSNRQRASQWLANNMISYILEKLLMDDM